MNSSSFSLHQPFWEDESNPIDSRALSTQRASYGFLKLGVNLTMAIVTIAPALILAVIHPLLGALGVLFLGIMLVQSYFQKQRRIAATAKINQIQQQARLTTQASHIDSAVHVAGHPLLARDQPIVLALKEDVLSFYNYTSSTPIDTLPIKQMLALHTVVYDDERVPHIDVIDNAAQALQLTFTRDNETWTCLLRRMRKVRPVDWYHAIQQARLSASRMSQPAA